MDADENEFDHYKMTLSAMSLCLRDVILYLIQRVILYVTHLFNITHGVSGITVIGIWKTHIQQRLHIQYSTQCMNITCF